MRIALIEWVDSSALHGWQEREHAMSLVDAETIIYSVGYVLTESDHSVTIVSSYHGQDGNVQSVLQIPKPVIKFMKYLETE